MKMNPYVLVASAAIGIVTAYISVVTQSDKTKSATDRLRDAQDQLKTSSDKLKDAQHQLSDATFNQEGASLRAEAAQKNYNDMVKQYGPDSLEARQALHEMKGANDDLAKANDTVKQKTQDKTNAEKDNANKKQVVVDAEHAKQREIDTTNNRIGMQILTLDTLSGKLNNLNGKVFNYTVNGAYYDYASKAKATGSGAPYKLPGMATGGNVDPGTAYVVGDNPDGSLNSTSEVFVPHTPGTILNSRDLKDVLMAKKEGGSAPSQVTTTNHFYVTINDMNAATAFFDKLDRDGILASKGLTTNRGMS
jgi:FKBP-type peptidyl-prolyl cis-trans isomerase